MTAMDKKKYEELRSVAVFIVLYNLFLAIYLFFALYITRHWDNPVDISRNMTLIGLVVSLGTNVLYLFCGKKMKGELLGYFGLLTLAQTIMMVAVLPLLVYLVY